MTKKKVLTDTRLKCFDYDKETVTSAYEGIVKAKDAMIKILEKEVKDLETKLHKLKIENEQLRLRALGYDLEDHGPTPKNG